MVKFRWSDTTQCSMLKNVLWGVLWCLEPGLGGGSFGNCWFAAWGLVDQIYLSGASNGRTSEWKSLEALGSLPVGPMHSKLWCIDILLPFLWPALTWFFWQFVMQWLFCGIRPHRPGVKRQGCLGLYCTIKSSCKAAYADLAHDGGTECSVLVSVSAAASVMSGLILYLTSKKTVKPLFKIAVSEREKQEKNSILIMFTRQNYFMQQ